MAATREEQFLLIELAQLSAGQAPGSFGPGQAYALLAGFVKLRDRVDQLVAANAAGRLAALEHLDIDARITALEQLDIAGLQAAVTALQQTVSDLDDRIAALEQERTADEATIADQAAQIGDLQARVAVLEENQPPPLAPAPA